MPPVSISAIDPTKNRAGSLRGLLQSLSRWDPPPGEVIAVDDGSVARLDAVVLQKAVPFRLRLFRNDSSVGPGADRNRGGHASRGELLPFPDDDHTFDRDCSGALMSQLAVGDKQVGASGAWVGGARA